MTLTVSRTEGLDCAKDRVVLSPSDGVLVCDNGGLGHNVKGAIDRDSKAELEASVVEGPANAGG